MERSQGLTLVAIFAMGVGLFLAAREPSVQYVAENAIQRLLPTPMATHCRARRSQCLNRLRNISTAIQNYAARRNGVLPAAVSQPKGVDVSWRVEVLPMFDGSALYSTYDRGLLWDDSPNDVLAKMKVAGYDCPEALATSGRFFRTTYVAVTGDETAWSDASKRLDDISRADGMTNTVLIGERHHDRPVWSEPRDAVLPDIADDLPNIRQFGEDANEATVFSSPHAGIANVMFVDGHADALSTKIDPAVLRALLTTDGGETIVDGEF